MEAQSEATAAGDSALVVLIERAQTLIRLLKHEIRKHRSINPSDYMLF